MGITAIAMVGLIIVQFYWINNAIEANREQFDREVNIALNNVVEKYEKRKALGFFKDFRIKNRDNMDSLFLQALKEKGGEKIDSLFEDGLFMKEAGQGQAV